MLTTVKFSCGHTAEVNLPNNPQKRLETIAELELGGLCPECRKAKYEEEDKINAEKCVCVRLPQEKYDKEYANCKVRLTGVPKEKDYVYAFIPTEVVAAESIKKVIQTLNTSYSGAVACIEKVFKEKYPELYDTLKPIELDNDSFTDYSDPEEIAINNSNNDEVEATDTVTEKVFNKPEPTPDESTDIDNFFDEKTSDVVPVVTQTEDLPDMSTTDIKLPAELEALLADKETSPQVNEPDEPIEISIDELIDNTSEPAPVTSPAPTPQPVAPNKPQNDNQTDFFSLLNGSNEDDEDEGVNIDDFFDNV